MYTDTTGMLLAILFIPALVLSFIILGLYRLVTKQLHINRFELPVARKIIFRVFEYGIYMLGMTGVANTFFFPGMVTFSPVLTAVLTIYYLLYLSIDLIVHRRSQNKNSKGSATLGK